MPSPPISPMLPSFGRLPRGFIFDFDGTLTTKDTTETLADFALAWHLHRGREYESSWEQVKQWYREDVEKHKAEYAPTEEARTTLEEEIKYQQSLKIVEENSFRRIKALGVFSSEGMPGNPLPDPDPINWSVCGTSAVQIGQVRLRPGVEEFFKVLCQCGVAFGIVSVNFSMEFVAGVLSNIDPLKQIPYIDFFTNYITNDGAVHGGTAEGIMLNYREAWPSLKTSKDKLTAMEKILERRRTPAFDLVDQHKRSIYIGDSETDIECLMNSAIVGIVISEDGQSGLMKTLARVGVIVQHISLYEEKEEKVTYWAREFNEIMESPLIKMLQAEWHSQQSIPVLPATSECQKPSSCLP